MIVVDASAIVDLLIRSEPRATRIAHVLRPYAEWQAPHVLDAEVLSALRRLTLAGRIESRRAREALEGLARLHLRRHAMTPLLERAWQLRLVVAAYDAFYVALAEALGYPLLTTDGRLGRSHGHTATVLVA